MGGRAVGSLLLSLSNRVGEPREEQRFPGLVPTMPMQQACGDSPES
jgi:hypothetical protein